eukprot:TRINITY_DN6482_c0_g1_i3.p1 TRINITY_DN6482_c0_g1~~TRINITY_DN6482_c0_g1_i3.p1  ORF type:complete len:526 (+),score=51.50 TRINITY_DN6482_c0_g1_i3:174-1751(+)
MSDAASVASTALSGYLLSHNDVVYTWDVNFASQVKMFPLRLAISKVSCGGSHALLLTVEGKVVSVGNNAHGQCGIGKTSTAEEPQVIDALLLCKHPVRAIACGDNHSLCVAGGTVYAFGQNNCGQLGLGHKESCSTPTRVAALSESVSIASICAGGGLGCSQSMAISLDQHCYAWGSNKFGQLGLGAAGDDVLVPKLVARFENHAVVSASCGWIHSAFLLAGSVSLYAVGADATDLGSFGMLPNEVMAIILAMLPITSVCRLTMLNSTFHAIYCDDEWWRRMFIAKWLARDSAAVQRCDQWNKSNKLNWKGMYGVVHKALAGVSWKTPEQALSGWAVRNTGQQSSWFSNIRIGKLFGGPSEIRCLMLGLDAAGKTTVLYKLKLGEVVTTIPTIGFNVETVEYKKYHLTCWDVGGPDKIRPLFRHYYPNTQALIFVVDSNDRERIGEAAEILYDMAREPELSGLIVLIFANKQDLPNAMRNQEIIERLGLATLDQEWFIQASCATTGDGLYEGLDWLSNTFAKRNM